MTGAVASENIAGSIESDPIDFPQPSKDGLYGSMGVCAVSPTLAKMRIGTNSSQTNGRSLYPQGTALRRLPEDFGANLLVILDNAAVQILQQPKHGVIVSKDNDSFYVPTQGYVGNDKVVFLVNIDGRIVKTVYYLKVVDSELNSESFDALYKKYCPPPADWQISANFTDANTVVSNLIVGGQTTLTPEFAMRRVE